MTCEQLESLQAQTVYHITQPRPGLFRFGNSGVYVDLIVGTHHALLWDTAYGFDDLRGLVEKITDLPLYVINSHGHVDHCCGNWQFPSAYIHPADMALCREHNTPQMRLAEMDTAQVPADFDLQAYLKHDCGILKEVSEGDVFDLGGRTARVVELPGHTAGSIGVYIPEEALLYVGDAINNFLWLFLPEAQSLAVYRETLLKAARIAFTHMLQSHHGPEVPRSALDVYLDLVDTLDFEAGQEVPAPGMPGKTARICIRGGLSLQDRERSDFAAIMIGQDKL